MARCACYPLVVAVAFGAVLLHRADSASASKRVRPSAAHEQQQLVAAQGLQRRVVNSLNKVQLPRGVHTHVAVRDGHTVAVTLRALDRMLKNDARQALPEVRKAARAAKKWPTDRRVLLFTDSRIQVLADSPSPP